MRWLLIGLAVTVVDAAAQSLTVLAFGDVNLGRNVGQQILAGDTLYPFASVRERLATADIVFVNLESVLSDQGGETRHPTDPYIFAGPLEGAASLRLAGVTVVSTANNHAFDYGRRGLLETIELLEAEGVRYTGTRREPSRRWEPVVVEGNGIRVGFLAYTEFVNRPGAWDGTVALYREAEAARDIKDLRKRVDVVIVSYHGGTEYTERPPRGTLRNLRALADAGAHVVVGSHPHVPQAGEIRGPAVILYSLGNFVFHQPQRYWTQVGFAASIRIVKEDHVRIDRIELHPFRAGLQPTFELPSGTTDSLSRRFGPDSGFIRPEGTGYRVRPGGRK